MNYTCHWFHVIMIDPLFGLISLLIYSDTERTLLGSRRRFGIKWLDVNMCFSDEGRILMENLYILLVMKHKNLSKEFSNKG